MSDERLIHLIVNLAVASLALAVGLLSMVVWMLLWSSLHRFIWRRISGSMLTKRCVDGRWYSVREDDEYGLLFTPCRLTWSDRFWHWQYRHPVRWPRWCHWPHAWVMQGWRVRTHWWQWRHRRLTHTVASTIEPRDTSYLSDGQRVPQPMVNTPAQALAFRVRATRGRDKDFVRRTYSQGDS
jgi:hypothetical protein